MLLLILLLAPPEMIIVVVAVMLHQLPFGKVGKPGELLIVETWCFIKQSNYGYETGNFRKLCKIVKVT